MMKTSYQDWKQWSEMDDDERVKAYYTLHIQKAYAYPECADVLKVQGQALAEWARNKGLPIFAYDEVAQQKERHARLLKKGDVTGDRIPRSELYMEVAKLMSQRSTCLSCKVGAVIVVDNRIVTTGYNGAPAGKFHCTDIGVCRKRLFGFQHWDQSIPGQLGAAYEVSRSVHAEQSCIAQAAKKGIAVEGGNIYVTREPCVICQRLLLNSGILMAYYIEPQGGLIQAMDLNQQML
jgi:dCMP deaminase